MVFDKRKAKTASANAILYLHIQSAVAFVFAKTNNTCNSKYAVAVDL